MSDLVIPKINYDTRLQASPNVFREHFGAASIEDWRNIWLSTEKDNHVGGLQFPTIPDQELQLRIHGSHSFSTSMNEAFAFYEYVGRHIDLRNSLGKRFLDFGCGWGRMSRPFMRDFYLRDMYGFEPDLLFCTIARSLNPYICFMTGDFLPDGTLPGDRFDVMVGWSIYSHLSELSLKAWLTETARVLRENGTAVFTTWGRRFLERLLREQLELNAGKKIHWYSELCLSAAGTIQERIEEYDSGQFVWFTNGASKLYGEAFLSRTVLSRMIDILRLPLSIVEYDDQVLAQDVFIIRKVQIKSTLNC
jgi:SAM-dependent methyltransferase